jgi:DNA-binding winged helix-turn-helix (wHTH) protein
MRCESPPVWRGCWKHDSDRPGPRSQEISRDCAGFSKEAGDGPWDKIAASHDARPALNFRFGPFLLDLDTRQLTRDGRELHLAPKAFDLLAILVQDRPKVMSKAVLQEHLWPATFVAEANLSNLVAEIREALGDRARTPTFIRTAHGFGYAFCGDATTFAGSHEPKRDQPSCWLEFGGRRHLLAAGEHVVGRDPDVEVRLDASTVSRRHARFVVSAEGTVLEDFGSKNGTFLGSERVTSPIRLTDGDAIRVGSFVMTFHARGVMPTDTQVQPVP